MKKMRRFAGLLLAMVMVMSMAVSVFADGETTHTITINNAKDGHTYEAYQILVGDVYVDGTNKTLSNVQWGANAKETEESLETVLNGLTIANAASYVDFTSEPVAKSTYNEDTHTYTIQGLQPGYYLVKDEDGSVTGHDAYTAYIIQVVENSVVSPKTGVPTVEKKVKDKNDTTDNALTDWQDSADHDIQDVVPFMLKATLGENLDKFATYKVVFHDTLSKGFTYTAESAVVKLDGVDVTNKFTVAVGDYSETNGTTITITCNDVKTLGAKSGSVITVEYTAELNDKAIIGSVGNPNEVYLEFSNNPNWDVNGDGKPDNPGDEGKDEPTGNTPVDKVIVFTYKVDVNKVHEVKDENGNSTFEPLEGAEFTLEKKVNGTWTPLVLIKETGSKFTFTGLDDGLYRITETVTPAGYNTIQPIYFEVVAEHDEEADNPELDTLTVTIKDKDGNVITEEVPTFTANISTGIITTDIENKSGTTLPETGGMGTTIFYVIGATLAIGAAVVMVTRKRMSEN